MENLIKANNLHSSIKSLEYFIMTLAPDKNIKRGGGQYDISSVLKTKVIKTFSILGSRHFGCGMHIEEINVPNELVEELNQLAKKRLLKLKKELSQLVKPPKE